MDDLLRNAERNWKYSSIPETWIRLLRISEMAGKPRFTREALIAALGPGEVIEWEISPTGFKAKIQNGVYPHRKHIRDLSTSEGYEIHEDWETVRDTTNWDGWVEVAWRDDDDDPELQIQVESSWQFEEEHFGDKIIFREYRYFGSVTNDEQLNSAMFDYDHWESMD